jgi:phenylalanyl-tRNA synthetase beta chain
MKISLNWLRDYVAWTGSVDELVSLLTRTGLEVADVATRGVDFPKVVIAQILESAQHPNADRLSVCRVDDGSGQPRQIVCGAKNYKVGDKVPLALPGAVLPGDFKIKTGKLRGVESEGMMCSAKELGLAENAEGLLILPPDAPVGKPIAELYPADTTLELEVTPNRGDWLSHFGVAREIAAFTGAALRRPEIKPAPIAEAGDFVSLEAPGLCPFYSVRRIRNVKVGPSPAWLRERLEKAGLRAINNVVDITNYVMLELGQPLHAFDAAKVSGGIVVRAAREGEIFSALDGREYPLGPGQLVIADSSRPVALAGVMGGKDSGVTQTTTEVLLESALFDAATVRRTARALDLHSDSSHRFERGVDPQGILEASARAAAMIAELAGGEAGQEVLVAGALPADVAPIALSHTRCRALLGLSVEDEAIRRALTGLGLTLVSADGETTTWQIPSHRGDLLREVDLIEEVSRVVGMENISGRLAAHPAEPGEADARYDFQMALRRKLVALGLSECRTSALISQAMLWQDLPALRVKNPLGEDQAFLRTSLLPGLLAAVARNIRQGAKTIGLFEMGRTFHAAETEEAATLGAALFGLAGSPDWRGGEARSLDWHDARGLLETLAGPHRLVKTSASEPLALAAEVMVGDRRVGSIGQLSPAAARAMDAGAPVLVFELSMDALRALEGMPAYQEVPKFPAVTRDIAIVCPLSLSYAEIEAVLTGANEELLAEVAPFDVFTDPSGQKLPADRKSIAISLTFRTPGRTLSGEEVNAACERIKQTLKRELPADFRE